MSKYDLFRRRIAPIAFVFAIGLLAHEQCTKHERTNATFVLDCGGYCRDIRSLDAELIVGGETIAQFHRAVSMSELKFSAPLPATEGELQLDVDLASGDHRHFKRTFHAEEGATVTIFLADDLH